MRNLKQKIYACMILSSFFGAFNSYAYNDQQLVDGKYYLKFNEKTCKIVDDGANNKCVYENKGYKIKLTCKNSRILFTREFAYCHHRTDLTIESNRTLRGIHFAADYKLSSIHNGLAKFDILYNYDGAIPVEHGFQREDNVKNINMSPVKNEDGETSEGNLIGLLMDGTPSVEHISEIFEQPAQNYRTILINVLDDTLKLNEEIASSHQAGHMGRYIESLKDCIAVLDVKNKYYALDWRVQECSRRVLVFGTVLNEIVADYAHVEKLKPYLKSITNLTESIRKIYGWDRGLAGNVSKATGSLLEVIQLELREILTLKISAGTTNFEIYSKLMKEVATLVSKVNSARSGDSALQRYMWDFVDIWNGEQWQTELKSLLSSTVDENHVVLTKIQLMFMAAESFNDLTKADLEIPLQ